MSQNNALPHHLNVILDCMDISYSPSTNIMLDFFCATAYIAYMLKNITLKIDEHILMRVRRLAVDENKSVSAWVSELIERTLNEADDYEQVRHEAIDALNRGSHLGGQLLSRESLYDRS